MVRRISLTASYTRFAGIVSSFSSLSGHGEGGFSDTNLQEVDIELIRTQMIKSELHPLYALHDEKRCKVCTDFQKQKQERKMKR